jgi:hypothetical protein
MNGLNNRESDVKVRGSNFFFSWYVTRACFIPLNRLYKRDTERVLRSLGFSFGSLRLGLSIFFNFLYFIIIITIILLLFLFRPFSLLI